MVGKVSGDDVCQGAHGEVIVAGDAASRPRLRWHIPEKRNGGEAHAPELLDVGGPGDLVRLSARCCYVLVVAWQGTLKAARKRERAKRKSALGVGDVVQHLPHAPLLRRVVVQRFFFRDLREKCLFQLILQRAKWIVAGHLVDVSEIVGRGFGGLRAGNHGLIIGSSGAHPSRHSEGATIVSSRRTAGHPASTLDSY